LDHLFDTAGDSTREGVPGGLELAGVILGITRMDPYKWRLRLRVNDVAAQFFALTVFLCDGLLQPNPKRVLEFFFFYADRARAALRFFSNLFEAK